MPLDQTQSSHLPPLTRAEAGFAQRFGGRPRLFQAPGRINIIGEHVDYAGGLVLPAAIDRHVVVAARANGERRLKVVTGAYAGEAVAELDALAPRGGWFDYVAGIARVLMLAGVAVPGADLWIESEVPIGSGLSSSAALEVAVARTLLTLAGRATTGLQVARWAQAAENDFVGAPCGIMDQYASANGVAGAALLLDCAALTAVPVPLPETARFLVVDSGIAHAHADSEYRVRREECEAAAHRLGVSQLAEVDAAMLPDAFARLPNTLARRCRHVVTETARVRAAAQAMSVGDLARVGQLLDGSHASLRDDMQVSAEMVDRLVAIAQSTEGVFGARMIGGGFGGSILALVAAERAEPAMAAIRDRYAALAGNAPGAFLCRAVGPAGEIWA